jgi:hypothetical protein
MSKSKPFLPGNQGSKELGMQPRKMVRQKVGPSGRDVVAWGNLNRKRGGRY